MPKMAPLYRFFFALAMLGLVASAAVHAAAFFRGTIPAAALLLFFPGIFIVLLPAFAAAGPRVAGRKLTEIWGAFFERCPRWLTGLAAVIIAYSLLAFFAVMVIAAPGAQLMGLTALQMVFYVVAAALLHPANLPPPDPTRSWPPPADRELSFSLAEQSLNGVRLGDPLDRLQALGRPDNPRPYRRGLFIYRRLGLIVESTEERLDYLGFAVAGEAGLDPCRLTLVTPGDARLALGPATSRGEIRGVLGEPAAGDQDSEEAVDYYRLAGLTLEFEYSPEGRLRRFNAFPDQPAPPT